MICPHCNQTIPESLPLIYFCPFCDSVIDKAILAKSLLDFDFDGHRLQEVCPSEQLIIERGQQQYEFYQSITQKDDKPFKLRKTILWSAIVWFAISTVASFPLGLPAAGVASMLILALCFHGLKNKQDIYTKQLSPHSIINNGPIRYYANDYVFGYTELEVQKNGAYQIKRQECKKDSIVNVLNEDGFYYIELDDNANSETLCVPTIFPQKELNAILFPPRLNEQK